jgi:hypothetical protein
VRIRSVDVAAVPAQREALIDLLLDTVQNGSSVGFVLPLPREEAGHYWDGLAGEWRANAIYYKTLFLRNAR